MTTTTPAPTESAPRTLVQALEPVRDALLADAETEAERIVAAAADAAHEIIATATAEADAVVEQARHRAERSARAHTDMVLARTRNDAHRVVLDTQHQLNRRLIDDVHVAARDLRVDPRYPALLDHLESLARNQLGDTAVIERDPEPDGGIVAEAGTSRVDYRLPILADRALDTLADDVAELWT